MGKNLAAKERRERKGEDAEGSPKDWVTILKDLGVVKMLRCRLRYFADGAVIGSRGFVNEAFESAPERFGPKRKD